jgi:Flp pilus assembly pilin Flp
MAWDRVRAAQRRAGGVLVALYDDERGQDLVEYALLTAAVGLASAATWPLIATSLERVYRALDTNTQGLWDPPGPGGGP